MTPEPITPVLRLMTMDDLPVVIRNERRAYSHPWTEGIFADSMSNPANECWLLSSRSKIVGHVVMSVGAGEAHLLNVCVNPEFQGHGFGGLLVEHIIGRARSRQAATMFLEVRASNQVAYNLYEKVGFNEIGVRRNYYPAYVGREDALVLALELV